MESTFFFFFFFSNSFVFLYSTYCSVLLSIESIARRVRASGNSIVNVTLSPGVPQLNVESLTGWHLEQSYCATKKKTPDLLQQRPYDHQIEAIIMKKKKKRMRDRDSKHAWRTGAYLGWRVSYLSSHPIYIVVVVNTEPVRVRVCMCP